MSSVPLPSLEGEAIAQPSQVCWRYLFGADGIAEEHTGAFACALCPLHCCSFEVRQTVAQLGCQDCIWACM